MKRILLHILLILSVSIYAQNYRVDLNSNFPQVIKKQFKTLNQSKLKDSSIFEYAIYQICWKKAYYLPKINLNDSIFNIQLGESFKWLKLSIDKEDEIWLRKAHIHFIAKDSLFVIDGFSKQMTMLLNYFNNHGYPLAKISLDEINVKDQGLQARLDIDKGRLIYFGKINVLGSFKIVPSYIEAFLNIKEGEIYSKEKLYQINEKLKQLPFAKVLKPSLFKLTKDKVDIDLFLDYNNQNQFQGIVGFQSNDQLQNRLVLTGDMALHLKNAFEYGSDIKVNWKGFGNGGQIADVSLSYPYLLGLDLGLEYELNFQKIDTNFLNVQQQYGLKYIFSWSHFLTIGIKRENTTLISIPSSVIQSSGRLPDQLDQRSLGYFVQHDFSNAPNNFIHRKGWKLSNKFESYRREVLQNQNVMDISHPTIDFSKSYDSLGAIQNYRFSGRIAYSISRNRSTIIPQLRFGLNYAEQVLTNEKYLIGGMEVLRGFDEKSIRTANYSVSTLAYHYYFQTASSLEAFFDYGLLQNSTNVYQEYKGLGVGLHLGMDQGQFSVLYAIGQEEGGSFLVRNAKFHFAYIQYL